MIDHVIKIKILALLLVLNPDRTTRKWILLSMMVTLHTVQLGLTMCKTSINHLLSCVVFFDVYWRAYSKVYLC